MLYKIEIMNTTVIPLAVLVINDDDKDFKQLAAVLKKMQLPISGVAQVSRMHAAAGLAELHSYQVIFLDLSSDKKEGLAVLKSVAKSSGTVPVVVLTETNDTESGLSAIQAGAQDYLEKDTIDDRVVTKAILYSIEKKKISESLILSNERYKLVSKATNDMVWDWDLLKNKVYRSREGWERLFGKALANTDDGLMADSWLERVHEDDRLKTDALIEQIFNDREMVNFEIECRMRRNDGDYVYVIDRGYAIRNENGEPIRLIGVTQNITEQKLAGQLLKLREQRFRSIIDKSNEGLILLGRNGEPADISASAKSILGFSETSDKASITLAHVHPDDRQNVQASYDQVVREYNCVKVIDYRYKKASGNYIWVEATYHNLFHEPSINAIVVHFRDISSRKIFDDILKNSEEKYRNLFNANPSSILIIDSVDGRIKEINDAALKELGYLRSKTMRLNIEQILPDSEKESFAKLSAQVQRKKKFRAESLLKFRTKANKEIYLESIAESIDYYGIKAMLIIGINVTKNIELEKKLAAERKNNQHDITKAVITAQEQERELLGKELHDNINQILVTTKLYIEYSLANESMKESFLTTARNFILTAIAELRSLSKSLLPPSLGEVGLIMALSELTENLEAVNAFKLHKDWLDLDETMISEALKLTVFRIVQEQMNNIIKHASAKNVWIKIKIKNQRLTMQVKDDGVGFDAEMKRDGVGLKNIKSRADLHKGIKTLKSGKGKGCELKLLFDL